MPQSTVKPFAVFTVRDSPKKGERGFWTRIGTAFPHQEGEGFNVRLDALPVDGKLVILPPKEEPKDEAVSATAS
jgi:hypothetical protein